MTFRFHRRLVFWNIVILVLVVLISGFNFPYSLVALAAGILLTLLVSYALKLRVAAPLGELFGAIQKIGDGDLQQRIAVSGDPEVSELVRATNTMVRNLGDTERQLRGSQRQVDSFVDAMTEGVMLIDPGGRITLSNRAFSRMISTDRDLVGKTTLDIFRNPELETAIRAVFSGDSPRTVEIVPINGRVAEAHIAGVPNLAGVVESAVVVFHDLTEIRKTERMRRDFVANVSHEFKTPLTAIRGYTETLLGGAVQDSRIATDFLHTVERNARHLESLVSDLLTLARLEAELPASYDTVNVKGLVDEQISQRQAMIVERNLRVTNDCPDLQLYADRIRLGTAVSNLIDNAVYYNRPSGEIRVSGTQDNGVFVLSIADTGEGIPPADLQRIFERFYRVDKARSRQRGGTGLGLSIVKHAVESQGGSISVSSKLGTGSQFNIRLPLRRSA
ncbi:MAG TPA: ATP-binding protein [Terriglobia bacterium]|nr:ATP-binding protein [Terriglobia bacterium]